MREVAVGAMGTYEHFRSLWIQFPLQDQRQGGDRENIYLLEPVEYFLFFPAIVDLQLEFAQRRKTRIRSVSGRLPAGTEMRVQPVFLISNLVDS